MSALSSLCVCVSPWVVSWLFATPWSVHGTLQARILEWFAIPISSGSSWPRDLWPGIKPVPPPLELRSHNHWTDTAKMFISFKWFSHWGLFWNCRQNSHLFQFFELSTRVCGFLAPWFHVDVCTCMLSHHSRLILCDPMDCSPPGPSVRGILQARALEGVAISFFRGSSQPRDGRQVLYHSATWEAQRLSPEESLSFLSSLLNKHLLRNWLFSLTRPMKAASFREITAAHPWSKAPLALLPRAI